MTALNAQCLTPHDRLLGEILQRAARLSMRDLAFLADTANALYAQHLEAEMRSAEFVEALPPDPDPNGV